VSAPFKVASCASTLAGNSKHAAKAADRQMFIRNPLNILLMMVFPDAYGVSLGFVEHQSCHLKFLLKFLWLCGDTAYIDDRSHHTCALRLAFRTAKVRYRGIKKPAP